MPCPSCLDKCSPGAGLAETYILGTAPTLQVSPDQALRGPQGNTPAMLHELPCCMSWCANFKFRSTCTGLPAAGGHVQHCQWPAVLEHHMGAE